MLKIKEHKRPFQLGDKKNIYYEDEGRERGHVEGWCDPPLDI